MHNFDHWPTTMTFNLILAWINFRCQGHRSSNLNFAETDIHTEKHKQTEIDIGHIFWKEQPFFIWTQWHYLYCVGICNFTLLTNSLTCALSKIRYRTRSEGDNIELHGVIMFSPTWCNNCMAIMEGRFIM